MIGEYRMLANEVERAGYSAPDLPDVEIAQMLWSFAEPWARDGAEVSITRRVGVDTDTSTS